MAICNLGKLMNNWHFFQKLAKSSYNSDCNWRRQSITVHNDGKSGLSPIAPPISSNLSGLCNLQMAVYFIMTADPTTRPRYLHGAATQIMHSVTSTIFTRTKRTARAQKMTVESPGEYKNKTYSSCTEDDRGKPWWVQEQNLQLVHRRWPWKALVRWIDDNDSKLPCAIRWLKL